MTKKTFIRPEVRLTAFEAQDIMATSMGTADDPNNNPNNGTNQFGTEPLNPGNFDWTSGGLGG
ncbi:MAG: hypothetical protein K6A78_00030 [Prevotella sp.]|nr:hypothetical protein [Prevotella sp.]